MLKPGKIGAALLISALAAGPLWAQADDAAAKGAQTGRMDSAQAEAQARKGADKVIDEALAALDATTEAITALDQGKQDEALAAIEKALGKLDVVLAMDEKISLAPVDVRSVILDITATPEEIRKARAEVLRLLKEGQMQRARRLLGSLASEVDIITTYLPLGSYPLALRSAAALIKDDKPEDAKAVLAGALGTLVEIQTAIPIPLMEAQALIDEAKKLAEKADRSDKDEQRLNILLDAIDARIAKGEALEYGGPGAFDPLKAEMKAIRSKTANGGHGAGFFDRLSEMFGKLLERSRN